MTKLAGRTLLSSSAHVTNAASPQELFAFTIQYSSMMPRMCSSNETIVFDINWLFASRDSKVCYSIDLGRLYFIPIWSTTLAIPMASVLGPSTYAFIFVG